MWEVDGIEPTVIDDLVAPNPQVSGSMTTVTNLMHSALGVPSGHRLVPDPWVGRDREASGNGAGYGPSPNQTMVLSRHVVPLGIRMVVWFES